MAHPGGVGRRRILLRTDAPNRSFGWLEDEFHHFGVTVEHVDGRFADVRGAATRYPWATCPGAIGELQDLVGKPLAPRASDIGRLIQMRRQCTHLFDLTGLIMAHIVRGEVSREYHVVIPDRAALSGSGDAEALEAGQATLFLNGHEVLRWALRDGGISVGEDGALRDLESGFRAWTEQMPLEDVEYCTIMRRAIMVSRGRRRNLDDVASAADKRMPALCYSFQPERAHQALRMKCTSRSYDVVPDKMLASSDVVPGSDD